MEEKKKDLCSLLLKVEVGGLAGFERGHSKWGLAEVFEQRLGAVLATVVDLFWWVPVFH